MNIMIVIPDTPRAKPTRVSIRDDELVVCSLWCFLTTGLLGLGSGTRSWVHFP